MSAIRRIGLGVGLVLILVMVVVLVFQLPAMATGGQDQPDECQWIEVKVHKVKKTQNGNWTTRHDFYVVSPWLAENEVDEWLADRPAGPWVLGESKTIAGKKYQYVVKASRVAGEPCEDETTTTTMTEETTTTVVEETTTTPVVDQGSTTTTIPEQPTTTVGNLFEGWVTLECSTNGVRVDAASTDPRSLIRVFVNGELVIASEFDGPARGFVAFVDAEDGDAIVAQVFSGSALIAEAELDRDCELTPTTTSLTELPFTGSNTPALAALATTLALLGTLMVRGYSRRELDD